MFQTIHPFPATYPVGEKGIGGCGSPGLRAEVLPAAGGDH